MQVIKIGGNELDADGFLPELARAVAGLGEPAVVVHGGGKAVAEMQRRLGLRPRMVDGLRVTDAESLAVAQMVLSGETNKRVVAALLAAGVDALGLSGVDGGLLRCVKKQHPAVDLGLVGEIISVRGHLLEMLLAEGFTPVISPISLWLDGQVYNVNADEAAAAVARALKASLLTFISNVPGVLDPAGELIPALAAEQAEALVRQGVIHAGMVPKVRAALDAVNRGVPQARIADLAGLAAGRGTLFSMDNLHQHQQDGSP